jgi:ATP-dependent DNA helicase RecG
MTDVRAPLADLVRVLGPPLDFLAATQFRRVERTRLPVESFVTAVAAARRDAADATLAPVLDELAEVVAALLAAPTSADVPRLGRAVDLLGRLRRVPPAGGAPYRPTTAEGIAAALATLAAPVASLRGIGPKRAAELERFGLSTVEDVLHHLPFRYEDRRRVVPLSDVRVGEEATVEAAVVEMRQPFVARRRQRLLEVVVGDRSQALVLVWFHQTGSVARRLRVGQRLLVHGRVEAPFGNGPARMVHPSVTELGDDEVAADRAAVVPVYEKPTGMPVAVMRRVIRDAVSALAGRVPAALPAALAERHRMLEPARALTQLHLPPADADVAALAEGRSPAHRALAFDELFFLQLGLMLRRRRAVHETGRAFPPSERLVPALVERVPFTLTAGQLEAIGDVVCDLGRPHPMRRLLQGDVGSGKTLVALAAALTVIEAGAQAALMAPTELLAEQHFQTVRTYAAPLGVETALLTGTVTGRARARLLARLAEGRIGLVVGTQALIQEGVPLDRLGLAIVDEQHRFGVLQRAALQRGQAMVALDVLVMSATPIPRTLALTLYGDLDVSSIRELPPGRMAVATTVLREHERDRAWTAVREAVAAGHQAYVVFPLVEESERVDLRAATTMARELGGGPLAGLRLGLVHGRMKADEKDGVMRAFKDHALDVLVSTTVIEVGIDVPNATVIVIEHADRFGLAQLHQLRGRVGRGAAAGRCLLVAPDWMGEDTRRRLGVLEETTDGFALAEADLALRGPGDFLGTRQAGLPPLRVASLVRDAALMREAADAAAAWLDDDPDLATPASRVIAAVLRHRWAGRLELAQVG